jgi:DegV family protein with EDD domain
MKIAIVTDSTSDLPRAAVEEHHITVTPINIMWGSETYVDGVTIQAEEFYTRLATTTVLPKTSQPSAGEFAQKYREAREKEGADQILCITVSKKLSGTYASAVAASDLVDFPVTVIDSGTASVALGFVVLETAIARDSGKSIYELAQVAHDAALKTAIFFSPSTLEFLHRGGRIGGAKRLVGTALNIKPILTLKDGVVHPQESVRTRKKTLTRMVELVKTFSPTQPLRVGIIHANAPDLEEFKEEVKSALNPTDLLVTLPAPAIGVHIGPGTIGISVLRN